MNKKILLIIFALTLTFVFTGCQGTTDKPSKDVVLIGTEEVFGAVNDQEAVTWVEEYSRMEGIHQKTFGDFDIYIVAFGEKPTGGYQVTPGVYTFSEGNKLQFEVFMVKPSPEAIVTQVLTYPNLVFAVAQGVDVDVLATHVVREVEDRQGKNLLEEVDIEGAGNYVQLEFVDKGNIYEGIIIVEGRTSVEKLKFTLEDGHNIYVEEEIITTLVDGTSSFTVELPLPKVEGFLMMAVLAEVDGQWKDDVFIPIN